MPGKVIHGHTVGGKFSPTFVSWNGMMSRCYQPSNDRYVHYGGRGISVCSRWHLFENFLADMGERPAGKTLDRLNNDGNYDLENCRWATPAEQARNKSNSAVYTWQGETKNLADWSLQLGIKISTLSMRLNKYGWTVDKAFSTGVK